jgi:MoxR-like ATPase
VAKTTLVKASPASLGASVRRIQFTPDLLPADITGTYVLTPRDGTFTLRPGPSSPTSSWPTRSTARPPRPRPRCWRRCRSSQVTIEGDRFELPAPFMVLATQNPIDLEGTYPLPGGADRPLPGARADRLPHAQGGGHHAARAQRRGPQGAPRAHRAPIWWGCRGSRGACTSRTTSTTTPSSLVAFTRSHGRVVLGCSPRATLGLVQAAKAAAMHRRAPVRDPRRRSRRRAERARPPHRAGARGRGRGPRERGHHRRGHPARALPPRRAPHVTRA